MSYEKALEIIAEEKVEQTGELDLSRSDLNKIPKELLDLKHLRSLDLRFNKIADVSFLEKLTNLQSLDLSSNKIADYRFLEKLTKLKSLNLSFNNIADASFLEMLTKLKSLDLRSNQIADYRFLEMLTKLKSLNLNSNLIADASFLDKLTNLQSLDLRSNQIADASFLDKLTNLQSLDLSDNNIADASFLVKLTKLQSLDLSYNHIADYRFLEKLTKLQSLDLQSNKIADTSFLEKLTNLQSLDLRSNKIADASFLEKLTKLQSLDLASNNIADASFLEKLTKLQSLDLASNNIAGYRFLEKLTKLQSLDLSSNQIADASFLVKLTKLQSLDLSYNHIADYRFLEKLTKLKSLALQSNKIADTSFLEKLTNLQSLNLSNNKIADASFLDKLTNLQSLALRINIIADASFLDKLTNLQSLDLRNNIIADISPLLSHIKSNKLEVSLQNRLAYRKGIFLAENPIAIPPIETVAKGNEAIVKYFEDLASQGTTRLYEAKLLVVGDGGTGKTSLARKMKSLDCEMPKEGEDRTKGIDIQALPIDNIKEPEANFLMNVWDFGGQGYYHSTHQFFLTKRSLYVLLNNTRTNKTDFNDWLQTISLFSDSSPVILIENEVGASKSELDLRGLQQHFDNILYVRVADISNTTDGRLQKLIHDIQIEVQRLPHVGSELPKQWVKIREELREVAKTEAHISDREFYRICKKYQITEKGARHRLGDLFHDLGIFLHFRDDPVLNRMVVLQKNWATKGVYTILDNELVRAQNGYFTIEQAENIWKNTPYEDWYNEMVSLMEKFRLCYRVPYSSPAAYISPNLLPIEKPKYSWDPHQNLVIHYDYEFMPKGLLGMLIVELHRYVKDIKNLAWRSGCIFNYQNTDAQVIETYGKRKLEIRVKGAHCVQLSTIMISEIDKLNDSFKRIKVKKLIPCPCGECQRSPTPQFYEYEDLMRRKEKNKRTIECSVSYDDIEVLEILEASYNEIFTEAPTIKQLIAKGKIKEAIDVFEEDFPDEGTLLLSRYNHFRRYRLLGMITMEDWSINMQQIAHSLLGFSENPPQRTTTKSNKGALVLDQLDQKLDAIKTRLEGQDLLLNDIIDKSHLRQHELLELLETIDNKEKGVAEDFAMDIIAVIERGMADFTKKVPDATSIIADWQKASQQLKLEGDAKVKLKWTIPFLFMKIEKEVAWNGNDWFRAIKEDIQRGQKGNWSEMFIKE